MIQICVGSSIHKRRAIKSWTTVSKQAPQGIIKLI